MKDGRAAMLAAVVAAGLVSAVILIWIPTFVPLFDLPNHTARHYLESRWLAGRDLGGYYGIHYRIMPNLGADLVVPPLMWLFPPLIACKFFLTGSLLPTGSVRHSSCDPARAWRADPGWRPRCCRRSGS